MRGISTDPRFAGFNGAIDWPVPTLRGPMLGLPGTAVRSSPNHFDASELVSHASGSEHEPGMRS